MSCEMRRDVKSRKTATRDFPCQERLYVTGTNVTEEERALAQKESYADSSKNPRR